ncbi:hypothetical protein KP509_32G000800 [Ceratopteris richardii]|uniref:Uncharacterized protein n=1 Tax=Ceratopteris richardii TaxID=49495 RepID=A0A8T2QRU7_CERRI|nr:hypothetical protein KP509_32G000800 [Ceratopteris richardii]
MLRKAMTWSDTTVPATPSRSPSSYFARPCRPDEDRGRSSATTRRFHLRPRFGLQLPELRACSLLRFLRAISLSSRRVFLRLIFIDFKKRDTKPGASAKTIPTKKRRSAKPSTRRSGKPSIRKNAKKSSQSDVSYMPSNVRLTFSGHCSRSACAPDAIADCIEFIKRSASSPSTSFPSPSSCSSSLSSSFSSPSSQTVYSRSSLSTACSSSTCSSSSCSPYVSPRQSASFSQHNMSRVPAPLSRRCPGVHSQSLSP